MSLDLIKVFGLATRNALKLLEFPRSIVGGLKRGMSAFMTVRLSVQAESPKCAGRQYTYTPRFAR